MAANPHKSRDDLYSLIPTIKYFLDLPMPKPSIEMSDEILSEAMKECRRMTDIAYSLLKKVDKHFRFYPEILFDGHIRGEFISKESEELTYFERQSFHYLIPKLQARMDELYQKSLPWNYAHVIKPFLESPKRPFRKEWKEPLTKIRKFLRNDRVKIILRKFETIEDRAFVVFILLPLIHYDVYEGEGEGEGIKMEKTIIMAKPLSKNTNEIIIVLSIHFNKYL